MAYDWNKLKQDSIIGFSYSSMEKGLPADLRSKVKDLVKASILLRSSPTFVKVDTEAESKPVSYSKSLLPDIIGEEIQDLMQQDGFYAFKFLVRFCHVNKLGLNTDLVLDLYDLIKKSPIGLKWLSLLLEDFQLEMLYEYEESSSVLQDSLLNSQEGFEMDLLLRSTQRVLWKALSSEEKDLYKDLSENWYSGDSEIANKQLSFIAEVWEKQDDQPAYLIAKVNEYLEKSGRLKRHFKTTPLALFPEVVHIESLKNALSEANFEEVAKVPQMFEGLIKNVYKNTDKQHAIWLTKFMLNERLELGDAKLFAKLLFGLSEEDYKSLWAEILMVDLFKGNEENLVFVFLEGWQSLPWDMVKRILTKLSPEHIYGKEHQFLNRLCYIVARSEANEALEFLSNVNSIFLNKLQLVVNRSFEQLFATRNSFLHLLNKYGHLPKD